MRKVGILSDTEQTRNRDFKKTQLASREHIASRLAKAKSIEKELKYADRVPARVPGGLVRVNLRETMTGVDRRVYVDKPIAQSNAESNVAQESGDTATVSGSTAKALMLALATGVLRGGQAAAQGAASALNDVGISTYPFGGGKGRGTPRPPQTEEQQRADAQARRKAQEKKETDTMVRDAMVRRSARSNKGKPPDRLTK